jgi:hypothetical protein
MSIKRRKFQRHLGERRYRKLFVIAVEGTKTEPQYFEIFNKSDQNIIKINCLTGNHRSSPPQVLKRMENFLREEGLKKTDEAWIIVDLDQWSPEQIGQIFKWSQSKENYGFALSNPLFEFWLLLHFEDGNKIASSDECMDRLKDHLPVYKKGIDIRKFTLRSIYDAIRRAKNRDNPPCKDWPRAIGGTTVYRLVEKLLPKENT